MMDADRKLVAVLLAAKLHNLIDELIGEHAESIRAYLGYENPQDFRGYILERLPDAVALLQEEYAKRK
ncbi:MAG: hypothetical protein HYT41_01155 [Candidatus Sungbacteria bacterium]|nr:hypothetical protein [Candidatus Sungbacteria bacterium]